MYTYKDSVLQLPLVEKYRLVTPAITKSFSSQRVIAAVKHRRTAFYPVTYFRPLRP